MACVSWPQGWDVVNVPIAEGCAVEPEPVEEQMMIAPSVGVATERGLQFTLETVLFEFDHTELLPAGYLKLEEFIAVIQSEASRAILIEGHTDNLGEESYNQELSELRAYAVQQALISNGINPERIDAKGLGENNPIANNDTEEGQQQNRRVEITLLNEDANTVSTDDTDIMLLQEEDMTLNEEDTTLNEENTLLE